jgi:hypothetical protein
MSAPTDTEAKTGSGQKTGWYVYGIVPGDVKLNQGVHGVRDSEVKLVRTDDLAALVSEVDLSKPLGTPEDLQAHEEIVNATATASPVLPMRFGAVLASEDAVAEELLEEHHDDFARALQELEGKAQYVVRGRYEEQAILKEILSEDREAAELREQLRDSDPDATRDQRIRLGEIINNAVEAKREQDTRAVLSAVEGHVAASSLREPTHELDAVYVALLVDTGKEDELKQAVDDLEEDWDGRAEFSVRGPMAPWDFVNGGQEAPG